jgi:hypothetical protein
LIIGVSRFLGYLVAISFLTSPLTVYSVAPVNFTFAQSQTTEGQFPQSIVASSSTDTTPHLLNLRATQQEGAGAQEVSGFDLDTTNPVSAQLNSQLLVFVTDSSIRVIEAKVRTASDQFIDLVPSTSPQATNTFSLANLPAGEYTLDVITQIDNTRAAYEGTLVIGQQPTTVSNEETPSTTQSPTPEDGDNGDDDEGEDDEGEDDEGEDDEGEDDEGEDDEGEGGDD